MAQELLYTSAPTGLLPGSQGFTTVAATRGMSAALREGLEGLCAYRPLFPSSDSRNPIVRSHVKLHVQGQSQSVLFRVGPAGMDYSGRPNKFAHALVVDSRERSAAGPAWLVSQPGVLETNWNGRVEWRERQPAIPRADAEPCICRAWQHTTGDAGWAGVLVQSFLQQSNRPAIFLVDTDFDLFSLFDEAIRLLPPERRWDVTFSTYLVNQLPNAHCLWRGMIAGTPEAKAAVKQTGSLVFDLRHPMGRAEGNRFVDAARTGRLAVQLASDEVSVTTAAAFPGASPRRGARTRTPVDPLAEIDWAAPEPARSNLETRDKINARISRRSRWAVWLMLFALLTAGGTVAVLRMMHRQDVVAIPTRMSPELVARLAGTTTPSDIIAQVGRLHVEIAGAKTVGAQMASIAGTRLDPMSATLRIASTNTEFSLISTKNRAPIHGATPPTVPIQHHAADTQPPADTQKPKPKTTVVETAGTPPAEPPPAAVPMGLLPAPTSTMHESRSNAQMLVLDAISLYQTNGNESQLRLPENVRPMLANARLIYLSAKPNVFDTKVGDNGKSVTLRRKEQRFSEGMQQSVTFEFVELRLHGDALHCRLLEENRQKILLPCWSDLLDSVIGLQSNEGSAPFAIIALRPVCMGELVNPSPTRDEEFRILPWGKTPAANGVLCFADASLVLDATVTRRDKIKDDKGQLKEVISRPTIAVKFQRKAGTKLTTTADLFPISLPDNCTCDEQVSLSISEGKIRFRNKGGWVPASKVSQVTLDLRQDVGGHLVPVFRVPR